ncbi:hypothetical protein F511_19572 [Dorcoceras hygrometricum]|uniref:Uncharacterized protein n=1 Tax=Dorcoceras hygrometricum TaxID=472368 RepID=A0A2Z7BFH5_9LAMI|nr:hypothetical protein F511_19572 [Dorcoceras hygrometricum]
MHVAVKEHRSSRPANQLAVISIEPLYPHIVSTGEIIGTTHLSAGHNVALSQVLNRSKAQYVCMNAMKFKSDFHMHIIQLKSKLEVGHPAAAVCDGPLRRAHLRSLDARWPCAGRAPAARRVAMVAGLSREMADGLSLPVVRYCAVSHLDLDRWPRLVARRGSALAPRSSLASDAGRRCAELERALVARSSRAGRGYRATLAAETRDAARCRRDFLRGGAAGLSPLRRVSGEVVTAGLLLGFGSGLSRAAREVLGRFSGRTSEDGGDDDQDIEDRRSVKPESIVIGLHCILHYP